jgi:anaerobic nitric oxide reductase flavorubredoxin
MQPIEIRPDVFWTGVNDRVTELFEGLWPIGHEGVSYNAYLIKDEKPALIDLSKEMMSDNFLAALTEVLDLSSLAYIIINHMEPDHSGALLRLRQLAPQATILGMPKTVQMLEDFYDLTENVEQLANNQTLSLGKHSLKFVYTPFVHWPETMMTLLVDEGILFSCDAFGSYGALNGALFDDTCSDIDFYETEALRYYTNIVAAFSKSVLRAIDKLSGESIEIVAPSHGLVWRKDPKRIITLYQKWASYYNSPAEVGITALFGTMYRHTESVLNAMMEGIVRENVPVRVFDVRKDHISYILPALWTYRGVLVGAPTYEGGLFPPMMDALTMADRKRIQQKTAVYFGSYAWSGGAKRDFATLAEKMHWDVLGELDFIGRATAFDLDRARSLGSQLAKAIQDNQ